MSIFNRIRRVTNVTTTTPSTSVSANPRPVPRDESSNSREPMSTGSVVHDRLLMNAYNRSSFRALRMNREQDFWIAAREKYKYTFKTSSSFFQIGSRGKVTFNTSTQTNAIKQADYQDSDKYPTSRSPTKSSSTDLRKSLIDDKDSRYLSKYTKSGFDFSIRSVKMLKLDKIASRFIMYVYMINL